MSDEKTEQGPSIEEILATVRLIMPDYDKPGQAPEIEPATPSESEPGQAVEPEPGAAEPPEPAPAAPAASADDSVISGAAASASVEAFSKLAHASELALEDASRNGEGTQSVENLITEMLRPMLRDWLDRTLPAIVERIVQKEIRRLVRQAEPD